MGFTQELAIALGHFPSVLIIEDDENLASDLKLFFEEEGWRVQNSFTLSQALQKITTEVFDLILADYFLPDHDILPLFEEVRRRSPITKVLVITGARDNRDTPLQAFRSGAADFVYKPFTLEELEERICELLAVKRCDGDSPALAKGRVVPYSFDELIGESPAIKGVVKLVQKVADSDLTVLITGETGTGKELVAMALHNGSSRKKNSFVAINCAAVPENLLEDELFGHAPGAYTDARGFRKGRFEEANRGTLFLDEIGDMPSSLQAKLLRVLEDGKVRKLGTNQIFEVDTRVVAATNSDLWEKVENSEFRKDLFYRLRMVEVELPPLRDRKEDIPLLANYFLKRTVERTSLPEKNVEPEAIRVLMEHDWPGNVRELRNSIEVAARLTGDQTVLTIDDFRLGSPSNAVQFDDSSFELSLPRAGVNLKRVIENVERNLIAQSLERTQGNKKEAAELLSIKRTTLLAKLRRMEGAYQF